MNEDLLGVHMYCVMGDGNIIPPERMRFKAVTCSPECAELRNRVLRKKFDDKECRFCHKPSSPNARKAFSNFRRWERANGDLAYPEQWAICEAGGMTLADFNKFIAQGVKYDIAADSKLYHHGWGATKPVKGQAEMPAELTRGLEILRAHYEVNGVASAE